MIHPRRILFNSSSLIRSLFFIEVSRRVSIRLISLSRNVSSNWLFENTFSLIDVAASSWKFLNPKFLA